MKKGIALILILVLLCLLCACDGGENTKKTYAVTLNDVKIEIDAEANSILHAVGSWLTYDESPSCAFDGLDRIYNYGAFEIQTYPIEGQEFIANVYLNDDTVATEEIVIGDNDNLAADVAECVTADLLILLTDIDGLYTADPRKDPEAKLIRQIEQVTEEVFALAGGTGSKQGTGGMRTKLEAAAKCLAHGISMVIANGSRPDNLYDILDGKTVGTLFTARKCE